MQARGRVYSKPGSITEARHVTGLSIAAAADTAGISAGHWHSVECGRSVTRPVAERIAVALGYPAPALFEHGDGAALLPLPATADAA